VTLEVKAIVRLDKRTKDLAKRLRPGEIAVIDHPDVDRVSAESLLEKKVSAVINVKNFSSGRYPNLGPMLLASAGVVLIDNVGSAIFDRLKEGDLVTVEEGSVSKAGQPVAHGIRLSELDIKQAMDKARSSITGEIEKFAVNTLNFISQEKASFLESPVLPELRTKIAGRHALVVVRGYDYKADLAILKSYIREMRPVLIAVDGGADALVEERWRPDLIVGDMDSVTDQTLAGGAELICHAYPDGRAPGKARLDALGLESKSIPLAGTSEDLALLIAYEMGAELIVAVGTHGHLIEFLDKGREGMASTFLVRLKVGDRLVDAKGVNQLYRGSAKMSHLLVLIFAALTTITVVIMKTPLIRLYISTLLMKLRLLAGL
jgi:uncharacterized membrane-anchored protein